MYAYIPSGTRFREILSLEKMPPVKQRSRPEFCRRKKRKTSQLKAAALLAGPRLSAILVALFRDAVEMPFAPEEQLIIDDRRRG